MATISSSAARRSFLPAAFVMFIRRRLIELGGLLVIAAAVAFAAALLSYDIADPSTDTSIGDQAIMTANWLGTPGAWVANILFQWVGIAGYVFPLAMLGWGWRIMTHQGLRSIWFYLALLPLCVVLAAFSAKALAPGLEWPVTGGAGPGGTLGWLLYDKALQPYLTPVLPPQLPGLLLGAAAMMLLLPAMGFSIHHWQTVGRVLYWPIAQLIEWRGARGEDEPRVVRRKAPPREKRERIAPVLGGQSSRPADPELDTPPKERKSIISREAKKPREGKRAAEEKQQALEFDPGSSSFNLPHLSLLEEPEPGRKTDRVNEEGLEQNARLLESVLDDFGVQGRISQVRPGPVVTLYELEPAPGTKSSRVIGLADDIARSMSAVSARVAVVPGRNAIGIELPNVGRETVLLRELLGDISYEKTRTRLPLALGKDIGGTPVVADLAAMPHLLIAGTTGSGKSVAINTMILSLLYKLPPQDCRFIMIDPKMLELSVYDDIPHLLTPVVTDPRKAVVALKWAVREMEDRYKAMSKLGVRNLAAYNERIIEAERKGEALVRTVQTGFDPESGRPIYEEQPLEMRPLPLIVIIVDEMADLMMVAGKDVEGSIQRLAQMARAAGLHLIMATQRPSVDVITGTIKANFPTRISFQVTSKIDSRTILGEQGAEQLLGRGDMLYMAAGGKVTRVHGPFVTDAEVEDVVRFLKAQGAPEYMSSVTEEPEGGFETILDMAGGDGEASGEELLYDQAVALVAREGKASTSFVQRHLQIGYNRAARIIERMEKEGVVSGANHVGKREVLVGDHSA
ncbi:DNA translocase FtsK 4TM domain-containing protein [Emcibacter sp. SYSU 3D8]|uniref:FtsK/SpoIIIE family DNA translocase n=1 Tax=Emcibacter sp. SYSU 3D8 TaxID=3133969 RepID=UPI0031FE830C